MGEPLTCLDCGMVNPPPEETCGHRDHFVGTAHGCPHCGRLMAACRIRPCSAVQAIAFDLEDSDDG